MKKFVKFASAVGMALMLAACGGGGGSDSGSTGKVNPGLVDMPQQQASGPTTTAAPVANTVPVTVSSDSKVLNSPRVSVTVCGGASSNCTTISNIILDTGSTGLRLFKSAMASTSAFGIQTTATGHQVGECVSMAGGPAWGQVMTADIQMAGEIARNVPIQVIDPAFGPVPTSCSNQGTLLTSTIMSANGVLGIANQLQDCGDACSIAGQQGKAQYFDCDGTTCTATNLAVPLAQQVTNPISKFASDNNGAILSFPGLSVGMAATATGTLTFGLHTQANNSPAQVTMVEGTSNGGMQTVLNGTSMTAVIESGSGVNYIPNASLPTCTLQGMLFYCPSSSTAQNVTLNGGGNNLDLTFQVANAKSVLAQTAAASSYAIADLAVKATPFGKPVLDLGMPFLYGRTLYLGLASSTAKPTIGVVTN